MECCRDVLVEFGGPALADALPWLAESDPGAAPELPPERRARTLSIAVHLLSIVEQRATHPTEAKRATVLEHHPALYLLLIRRADLRWTPSEQGAIRCEALARLTVLWRTGEIVLEKPDVASARPNIAHYLRNGLPDLLALHDERLRQAWTTAGLEAGSHHERAQSTCAGGPNVGGRSLPRSRCRRSTASVTLDESGGDRVRRREEEGPSIRTVVVLVVAGVLVSNAARAACDPDGVDAPRISAARAAIDAACPCDTAASHGAYVQCAAGVVRGLALDRRCVRALLRCVGRSSCGRTGAAVCCRTRSDGTTRGRIVRSVDRCRAPKGGSACLAARPSACDACTANGCAGPGATTTTTAPSSTTTTTLFTGTCGNGIIEPGDPTTGGEQCDGQSICGADCLVHAGASCDAGGGYCFGGVSSLGFETYWNISKPCYRIGGQGRAGVCTPGEPTACAPPPPDIVLPPFFVCGTIIDRPLPATTLCCQQGATCKEQTVASDSQVQFFPCNIPPFGTDVLVIGTCSIDGHCVPAS